MTSLAPCAAPCIWMSAGLLRYRLCDRAYDCAGCPLDAALRGDTAWPTGASAEEAPPRALRFPEDRLYSTGHSWLQAGEGAVARAGLDALAAALVGAPSGLRALRDDGEEVPAGGAAVALDLAHGALALEAATSGTMLLINASAARDPRLVAEDPYGEGWLYELVAGPAPPLALLDAEAARAQARHDLRHFGRRAALAMLEGADDAGATMGDGGAPLTDLRGILGPQRYLQLLRELVH